MTTNETEQPNAPAKAADGRPAEIRADQWGLVAEDVKAGRCVVAYCHMDTVKNVYQHRAGWYMVWGTWYDEELGVSNDHLLAAEHEVLEVEWLPPASEPPPANAEAGSGDNTAGVYPFTDVMRERVQARLGDASDAVSLLKEIDRLEVALAVERDRDAARAEGETERRKRLLYGVALEKIANKVDAEKPIKLLGETDHSYGQTFGMWMMGNIARKALDEAREGGEGGAAK